MGKIKRYIKQNKKKIILYILAIIYLLMPIDLIPDVPIVGFFDDILALTIAFFYGEKKKK